MKIKGIYTNLEKELKDAKITRTDLEKILPFNINTVTRKLADETDISFKDATIIKDYLEEKTGKQFELEYLFDKE